MPLMDLLRCRSKPTCEASKAPAIASLESEFASGTWGIDPDFSYYTPENKKNIWDNELRGRVRTKLEANDVDQPSYGTWLGDVHFLNIAVYSRALFDTYRSNAGWRVVLMAMPRANVIALGIASHYQNAQNHNKLGAASNLLYDVAAAAVEDAQRGPMFGRKISREDWDRAGLLLAPITDIAGVVITDVSPDGLHLKDIRTTTLKKILASFITVKTIPASSTDAQLKSELEAVRELAEFLVSSVYPFDNLEQFEGLRALALQDLAAAGVRVQLGKRSATRSVVRVYHGPPGTGKTLTAVREAVKLVEPAFTDAADFGKSFSKFNEYREQCAFITFHPSLQYEDLVESIRPLVAVDEAGKDEDEILGMPESATGNTVGELQYRIHEGLLLRMIRRASEHPGREYVVVIDEINRGDVSRILGPLISALEPDKRAGAEFPIGVELQYPRVAELESRLFLPSNLHIIGTMNSSDRNIALVDHALRRRFEFVEVPPEPQLLHATDDAPPIDCAKLLTRINRRIAHLLDSDHCIGHGYFVGCAKNILVIERLAKKVIPLLREYFYGNEGLMLLVLGDSPHATNNVFQVIDLNADFEDVFAVDADLALAMGYRATGAHRSLQIDPRFWNPSRAIPGPDDENYAVQCVLKIYQSAASAVEVTPPAPTT